MAGLLGPELRLHALRRARETFGARERSLDLEKSSHAHVQHPSNNFLCDPPQSCVQVCTVIVRVSCVHCVRARTLIAPSVSPPPRLQPQAQETCCLRRPATQRRKCAVELGIAPPEHQPLRHGPLRSLLPLRRGHLLPSLEADGEWPHGLAENA